MPDGLGLEARDRHDVGEAGRHVGHLVHDDVAGAAPQLAGIAARIAVRRPACPRQGLQPAGLLGAVVEEAPVGAHQRIFVQRVDGGQAGGRDGRRDGGRKGLGPAVDVDEAAPPRQAREQLAERRGGGPVPDALGGGGQERAVADEVLLAEADGADALPREVRRDRPGRREHDGVVAPSLQADGAVEGDARLPARDVGMVDHEDDREGGWGWRHGQGHSRWLIVSGRPTWSTRRTVALNASVRRDARHCAAAALCATLLPPTG